MHSVTRSPGAPDPSLRSLFDELHLAASRFNVTDHNGIA
jgi:hypothetical protein